MEILQSCTKPSIYTDQCVWIHMIHKHFFSQISLLAGWNWNSYMQLWLSARHLRLMHDDVIKWKHFPGYWPFVRGFTSHRWIPLTKGQWRRALMFPLICAWINGWVSNRGAGDLRRRRAHYDVPVMARESSSRHRTINFLQFYTKHVSRSHYILRNLYFIPFLQL